MKKIIIATILILAICCIGVFIYINDKDMSKEEFISLVNSFSNVSNVKIEEKEIQKKGNRVSERTTVICRKEGKTLTIQNGVSTFNCIWTDSQTKEKIIFDPNLKEYSNPEYKEKDDSRWDNVEYKFIGYKFYKFTKCVVVELKYINEQITRTEWVDTKKGTVLKAIDEGKNSWGEEYELITECTPTYGVVTDEDVQRPNVEGYRELHTTKTSVE